MYNFLKIQIWSRKIDLFILTAFLVLVAGGWVVYSWGWPMYRWHFHTKPALLAILRETGGPRLQSLRAIEPAQFEFEVKLDGVCVASPLPVVVDGARIVADTFSLFISEDFPEIPPGKYFALTIGPLTVTEANINAARTVRERTLAVAAVENRAILFGGAVVNGVPVHNRLDRATLIEGSHSTVIMWSSPESIAGVVMAND